MKRITLALVWYLGCLSQVNAQPGLDEDQDLTPDERVAIDPQSLQQIQLETDLNKEIDQLIRNTETTDGERQFLDLLGKEAPKFPVGALSNAVELLHSANSLVVQSRTRPKLSEIWSALDKIKACERARFEESCSKSCPRIKF